MTETKVTALVLSFNRTAFLRQALESVGSQTETRWTLLLSDCSSNEEAAKEIEAIFTEFSQQHPDHTCRLLRHKEPMRQHLHTETAMKEVKTPYVALLDDDDYWFSDHLHRTLNWLESSIKNGLAIDNAQVVDEHGENRGILHPEAKNLPATGNQALQMEYFLRTFYGSTSGFVFRCGAYDGWPLPSLPLIDVHIAFAVSANGFNCYCFRETGYAYREHGGSNYEKGAQVFRERHIWRCRLAKTAGFRILTRCPKFILLYFKSLCSLAKDWLNRSERPNN